MPGITQDPRLRSIEDRLDRAERQIEANSKLLEELVQQRKVSQDNFKQILSDLQELKRLQRLLSDQAKQPTPADPPRQITLPPPRTIPGTGPRTVPQTSPQTVPYPQKEVRGRIAVRNHTTETQPIHVNGFRYIIMPGMTREFIVPVGDVVLEHKKGPQSYSTNDWTCQDGTWRMPMEITYSDGRHFVMR